MNSGRAPKRLDIDPVWLMRIFTIVPVVLILLSGAGAIWIYFFVLSLLPASKSTVDIPDLRADVRVVRDSNGVPGIIAEQEADLPYVLGYVMAQDRLWQMDYLRRASTGRLAEILGSDYVAGDHFIRTLRKGARGVDKFDDSDYQGRIWIERFVKGINRYISTHSTKLPVEFSLLEYRPGKFTVQDVLDIFFAVAWESSPASMVDPALVKVLGRLGPKKAFELFPRDPAAPVLLAPSYLDKWSPSGVFFASPATRAGLLRAPALKGGAAWAIAGERARSGRPMAGSNVYQDFSAPGFWYRARLSCPEFSLVGAFVPGMPVALSGSNGLVGWSAIVSPADNADLYVEMVDSDTPSRYWRLDRWKPLKTIKEKYRIRGGGSVTKSIKLTETGPLVSDVHDGKAMSLRWTGQEGLGVVSSFYRLNRAKTGSDVNESLKSLIAPCLNVTWASADSGFGVRMAGRIPIRPSGGDGLIPLPGWTAVHDWGGFVPYGELPSKNKPSAGIAAIAGERPDKESFTIFSGCYWDDDSRARRIAQLLSDKAEHHEETFRQIQTDDVSPVARNLVPLIMKAAESTREKDPIVAKAVETLSAWDFRMTRDSAAAAVFALFYQALTERLFSKDLGADLFWEYTRYPPLCKGAIERIFLRGQDGWLQGSKPGVILETCLAEAVHRGRDAMGDNVGQWKWASLHTATFYHPVTAKSRFLELLYDVGPVSLAGASDTINFAGWSKRYPFHATSGVTLRTVADMTHPPQVFGISSLGASAHFFSKHYKDQLATWLKGRSSRDPILKADITKNGFNAVLFKSSATKRMTRALGQDAR